MNGSIKSFYLLHTIRSGVLDPKLPSLVVYTHTPSDNDVERKGMSGRGKRREERAADSAEQRCIVLKTSTKFIKRLTAAGAKFTTLSAINDLNEESFRALGSSLRMQVQRRQAQTAIFSPLLPSNLSLSLSLSAQVQEGKHKQLLVCDRLSIQIVIHCLTELTFYSLRNLKGGGSFDVPKIIADGPFLHASKCELSVSVQESTLGEGGEGRGEMGEAREEREERRKLSSNVLDNFSPKEEESVQEKESESYKRSIWLKGYTFSSCLPQLLCALQRLARTSSSSSMFPIPFGMTSVVTNSNETDVSLIPPSEIVKMSEGFFTDSLEAFRSFGRKRKSASLTSAVSRQVPGSGREVRVTQLTNSYRNPFKISTRSTTVDLSTAFPLSSVRDQSGDDALVPYFIIHLKPLVQFDAIGLSRVDDTHLGNYSNELSDLSQQESTKKLLMKLMKEVYWDASLDDDNMSMTEKSRADQCEVLSEKQTLYYRCTTKTSSK